MSTKSQRYFQPGSIADGPAFKGIDENLSAHTISIVFYTNSAFTVAVDKATMTGNVVFEMSETGEEFGTMPEGTLTLGTTTYDRPNTIGSYSKVRATFNAVTGASHYKMLISSFEN